MTTSGLTLAASVMLFLGSLAGFAAFRPPHAPSFERVSPTTADAPPTVDVKLHRQCLYPIVQLVETGKKGGSTGFVVRSEKLSDNVYYNLFLTCAHCVRDSDMEAVVFQYEDWSYVRNTLRFRCVFYGVNDEVDVAVGYFLSDQRVPTAKLCRDCKTYVGSEVFKVGCGLGQEPRLDYGKITRPVRATETEKYIRHSAQTVPGDSGSPVYHDYRVIGITTHISATLGLPVFGLAFCAPIGRVHRWSKESGGFYDHVFEQSAKMPKFPMYRLEVLSDYEIKE